MTELLEKSSQLSLVYKKTALVVVLKHSMGVQNRRKAEAAMNNNSEVRVAHSCQKSENTVRAIFTKHL